jgi:predicted PurR-regulated permease PerM
VSTQLTQFAQQAPSYLEAARSRALGWTSFYEAYRLPAAVRDAINTSVLHATELVGRYVTEGLGSVIIQVLGYLPRFVLIPILAFFLLKDSTAFRAMALRILPQGRWRSRGREVLQDISATLAVYIRAQLIACVLIGTICTVGFSLIGVPYALVLGIMAGLLEFVPLVGPLVVGLMAAVIASFVSSTQVFVVVAFLGLVRLVEDYVIYPRLIGQGIHLHPLAVIVAVLCGAELASVAGVFLAIPTAAIMSVGIRHWLRRRGHDGLTEPVTATRDLVTAPASAGTRSDGLPSN